MGEYHGLINEMRLVDHESYYKYFHMTPTRFDNLLSLVGPLITRQTTIMRAPVSAGERLAVTIRYLVTGDSMQTISFSYRLGHSTVCGIIDDTCSAIWEALSPEYLRTPANSDEWRQISDGFESTWNFPHCVGAIDGKHIMIQAPHNCISIIKARTALSSWLCVILIIASHFSILAIMVATAMVECWPTLGLVRLWKEVRCICLILILSVGIWCLIILLVMPPSH